MPRVLHVTLICSDEACAVVVEAWAEDHELDRMGCDCGCALVVIAISEPAPAALAHLPARRTPARAEAAAA